MYRPPRIYHLLTDTGHCANFTINYDGDRKDDENVKKMVGEYKFIGNVVGGSPIYEGAFNVGGGAIHFYIYKEFRKKPHENTWRGAVILFIVCFYE